MKIFYAVQATGNGHISRAMTLLPYLQEYGTVDIFLSGDNSHLVLDAPVKYRSKGISLFYNCKGGLDYWKMVKRIQPLRVMQEIRDLPVEKYDMVLNDFDFITSAACARKKIPSIHFGHQASFQSAATPRPVKKDITGEWLLKNYVKAAHHVGLHFKSYEEGIFPAVIKNEILEADPCDNNFILVYLPSYCEKQLTQMFRVIPDFRFRVFSRETKMARTERNISFVPVTKDLFNESLITCTGIITGAGFETPAEALHLGKKILATPIRGQYEQQCNAAALQQMGITCLTKIDESFPVHFYRWIQSAAPVQVSYSNVIPSCLNHLFSLAEKKCSEMPAWELIV
jgi:uncharacterized protein (TIGR00661 family)